MISSCLLSADEGSFCYYFERVLHLETTKWIRWWSKMNTKYVPQGSLHIRGCDPVGQQTGGFAALSSSPSPATNRLVLDKMSSWASVSSSVKWRHLGFMVYLSVLIYLRCVTNYHKLRVKKKITHKSNGKCPYKRREEKAT